MGPCVRRDDSRRWQFPPPPPSASTARLPSAVRRSRPRRWRNPARRPLSCRSASCAATAPTKQSPAPVVSTALTVRPATIDGSPSTRASTPRLPSVTQMILSRPIGSERAASMKRARSSLSRSSVFVRKPSSVSLRIRISTRSSSSAPHSIAGAGLRMVVAPTARARLKKAPIAGSGISNWLTAMSPFASTGEATSATLTSALAPGMTTMVLSALADVMTAVPVWTPAVACTKLRSTPCAARNARN